jgi:heme exporter protein A
VSLLVPGTDPRTFQEKKSNVAAADAPGHASEGEPSSTSAISLSATDELAIRITGLNRRFGSSRALADLSLDVRWNEQVAVLGPNGAGKTSLLRILATLARPTSGEVFVGGLRLPEQAAAIRRHVGFVAHQTLLYDDLTIRENLEFYGKLYGVPALGSRIGEILKPLGIDHRADDRVRALSRGLQQRAALARAILHDPPILLLDEPETGLDVAGADILNYLMADAAGRRRTVLLTSHDVGRAVNRVDRVVVIVRGRVALDRPVAAGLRERVESIIRGERATP